MLSNSKSIQSDQKRLDAEVEKMPANRRNEIIDIFDLDESGLLCENEVQRFLQSLGKDADEETTQNLMKTLDETGDGVGKQEFLRWMVLAAEGSKETVTVEQAAQELFALFDQDGDGNIAEQ